jgi:hypothetical protein
MLGGSPGPFVDAFKQDCGAVKGKISFSSIADQPRLEDSALQPTSSA